MHLVGAHTAKSNNPVMKLWNWKAEKLDEISTVKELSHAFRMQGYRSMSHSRTGSCHNQGLPNAWAHKLGLLWGAIIFIVELAPKSSVESGNFRFCP